MTPDRLRQCLYALRWSRRCLAVATGHDAKQAARWAAGSRVPTDVAEWLELAAAWHAAHPPPKRR